MNRFIDDEAEASDGTESRLGSEEEYGEMEREYEEIFTERDGANTESVRALLVAGEPIDRQAEFEHFIDEMIQSAKEREEVGRKFRSCDETWDLEPPGGQEGDSPLWRINCRIGTEELAVLFLLQRARPYHGLKSAFTRSAIPGCLYVESRLNKEALDLLSEAPGTVIGKSGVKKTLVDPQDYIKTLTTRRLDSEFAEGDWVQVKKGLYKGDLGLVDCVHGWGVTVLLIPRISAEVGNEQKKKRKVTYIQPTPRLFDPKEHEGSQIKNTHSIGNLKLQNGLLSMDYEFSYVKPQPQSIPYNIFRLFELSNHQRVQTSTCLHPQEWHFASGDRVYDALTGKQGTAKRITRTHIEVDFGEDEEVIPVSWRHARKIFIEGDYATVASGIHAGRSGWIVSVKEDVATIIDKEIDSDSNHDKEHTLKQVDVFVNSLKLGASNTASGSSEISEHADIENRYGRRHPWIDIKVLISRHGHPRKGETGIIIAVLPPTADSKVQRIEIQLTRFNPFAPFTRIIADSTDVVQESSHQQLPITASNIRTFKAQLARQTEIENMVDGTSAQGGRTPMPNHRSSTPAWDPSSDISNWTIPERLTNSESNIQTEASSSSNIQSETAPSIGTEHVELEHVLLNPLLTGATVFVVEKAEPSKSISITLHCNNGTMSMRKIQYHTSIGVHPDSVIPRHPNPTHDNGLLLVIRGDHCGKYARRLYHRHRQGQSTLIIVRVVKVEEGSQDVLTDEELELNVEYLTTVDEASAQKNLNKKLMTKARQEYKNRK